MNPVLYAHLLVFLRASGFIVTVPLLSNGTLPKIFRIGLALLCSVLLTPLIFVDAPRPPSSEVMLALNAIWEATIGAGLGLVFVHILAVAGAAGAIMDMQSGLANASILNPASPEGGSQTLLSTLMQTLAMLAILVSDLHLVALEMFAGTFRWAPPGQFGMGALPLGGVLLQLFFGFFAAAVSLAFPVLFCMIGLEVALAFLSRMLPSLNMLVAAAPLRIFMGLVFVSLSLPLLLRTIETLIRETLATLGTIYV